jgi:DNA-directed RNA polymerase specialized sigma subunit
MRPSGPRQPSSAADDEHFAFPTTLEDLAEAVNLRPDDVAFAMVESGLAQYRSGGKKKVEGGGEGNVKMEEDGEEEEKEEEEEETLVVTPELVELVAKERRVVPLPMLDVAYVTL